MAEWTTEVRLRYAGFREGGREESCLTYATRSFSLYEQPGVFSKIHSGSPSPYGLLKCV